MRVQRSTEHTARPNLESFVSIHYLPGGARAINGPGNNRNIRRLEEEDSDPHSQIAAT